MDASALRRHATAILIFAATLVLRLSSAWQLMHSPYGAPVTGDMRFYAEWARRIADGQLTDFHAFYGQPLYAYLLGGLFSLVGFQPGLVAALQAALDAATGVLIYLIAVAVFSATPERGRSVGCFAALGWAFFVPAAAYSGLLIPAALTVFAWWFCIWWLLARSGDAKALEWLGIAIFVGVIAMASAPILFALPLFAWRAFQRRYPGAFAAIAAGVVIGTAPAWSHNTFVARDPVFLSAHSGVNFWIGNNPEANGYPRVPRELPSEQAALLEQSIKVAEAAAGTPLPRSAVSDYWSQKARDYIASDPGEWLRLLAIKARNFWNAFEYDDLSSVTPLRDAGIVPPGVSFGVVAAFGLPGLVLALRLPRARYIAAAVLLQLLALLPVFVNERYRLAAAPGLLLLGAVFLAELSRAIYEKRWVRVALALVAVAVSAWFVTISPSDRALWSLNDYKTARRHLMAGEFALGEMRMRRALGAMLGRQQDLSPAVANGFAEIAREQAQNGDVQGARATVRAALAINPRDERLRQLDQRLGE
jgi:hypothetical protein